MDEVWKVVQLIGGRAREVFAGLEADAVKYMTDHFPRIHQEANSGPGTADALLVSPTGETSAHVGDGVFHSADEHGNVTATATATATAENGEDEDDENA